MKRLFKILIATVIIGGLNEVALATDIDNNVDISNNNTEQEENITLDGMIGPYDPNDPDSSPDFSQLSPDEIEGTLPDNYYTIAVTVPTNMQFAVVSGWGRGDFYSPKYTIENRATRPIYVSVKNLEEEAFTGNEEFNKLYLRQPIANNEYTELDLYLGMLNVNNQEKNRVHLTEDFNTISTPDTQYLGKLGLKESGILQFESSYWDVPGLDAPDKHAKNDFTLQLEFSLEDPIQRTESGN